MIFAIAISLLCGVGLAEKCTKGKTSLPTVVKAIVDALFPSAEIQKVEVEEESIKFIEVLGQWAPQWGIAEGSSGL